MPAREQLRQGAHKLSRPHATAGLATSFLAGVHVDLSKGQRQCGFRRPMWQFPVTNPFPPLSQNIVLQGSRVDKERRETIAQGESGPA